MCKQLTLRKGTPYTFVLLIYNMFIIRDNKDVNKNCHVEYERVFLILLEIIGTQM